MIVVLVVLTEDDAEGDAGEGVIVVAVVVLVILLGVLRCGGGDGLALCMPVVSVGALKVDSRHYGRPSLFSGFYLSMMISVPFAKLRHYHFNSPAAWRLSYFLNFF
ncbi:hypothetical protein SK128_022275 [Halocaridina rubra]|uniref:Uncharacterized protein n=1 Tax=Halocaridina rubra TaxID=373956 RepID=A0AAN8ZU74_HALRR